MRMDVLDLQRKHHTLAEQFISLRDELQPSVLHNLLEESCDPYWQAQVGRCYEAYKELKKLIIQIQKQPSFSDFLHAPGATEL